VSEATARETGAAVFEGAAEGPATIGTYTVVYQGGEPKRVLLIAELAGGGRTLASSDEPGFVERATREELCGRRLRITAGHQAYPE
jgi:hypothetical protein